MCRVVVINEERDFLLRNNPGLKIGQVRLEVYFVRRLVYFEVTVILNTISHRPIHSECFALTRSDRNREFLPSKVPSSLLDIFMTH